MDLLTILYSVPENAAIPRGDTYVAKDAINGMFTSPVIPPVGAEVMIDGDVLFTVTKVMFDVTTPYRNFRSGQLGMPTVKVIAIEGEHV